MQQVSKKKLNSERFQIALSILTLFLLASEWITHPLVHRVPDVVRLAASLAAVSHLFFNSCRWTFCPAAWTPEREAKPETQKASQVKVVIL